MLPVSVWTEEEVKLVIKTEIGDDSVLPLFLHLLPLKKSLIFTLWRSPVTPLLVLQPAPGQRGQHLLKAWRPFLTQLSALYIKSSPRSSTTYISFQGGLPLCTTSGCHPLWLNQQPLRWHHCLGLLSFTDIPFVTYWRSVATLHCVDLSVTLFQQHLLTRCLCITICYGDLWSVTFDATVVTASECHACCSLILRNCHTHPNFQQPPPWWLVSSLQHWGKTLSQHKDYDS